mgnify:CR=1 FL=1
MKTIGYIIQKEFKQIFRNKGMLPIIFVLPLLQLVILSNAATYEIKNIAFGYVDNDKSPTSRALIDKFEASTYFNVLYAFPNAGNGSSAMLKGDVDVVLEIPSHFERDLQKDRHNNLGVTINAIDGAAAGVQNVYVNQIVKSFNNNVMVNLFRPSDAILQPVAIEGIPLFWYNETLNYKTFMVPGILVLLLTLIGGFITALNIVKEKEIGTIEQINVTPIKKWQFILGKLIPFWIVGMIVFTVGLIVMYVVYGIFPKGNMLILYLFAAVYLIALLGLGLLISTFSNTQLQAMFVAYFFMMLFMLMSGFFTSLDSMPGWARQMSNLTPVTHFIKVVRLIVLNGSGLSQIKLELVYLFGFAILLNGAAILNYRKTN